MSAFSGVVCDLEWDYRSELFASGMTGGAAGCYVLETNGASLNVYYIYDARASLIEPELIHTTTMADSSSVTSPRIEVSRSADLVAIHWRDQTGCYYRQSTDGGLNWSTTYTVGSTFADSANDDAALGFAIWGATRLACGNDGSGNYGIYRSTNGSTWAQLAGSSEGEVPIPQITVRDGNVLYYTLSAGGTGVTEYLVTFDSIDDYAYTSGTGTNMSAATVAGGGNPDDCIQSTIQAGGFSGTTMLQVNIDPFETAVSVTFSFDCYMSTYARDSGTAYPRWRVSQGGVLNDDFPDPGDAGTWVTSSFVGNISSLDPITFRLEKSGTGAFSAGTLCAIDNVRMTYDSGAPVAASLWRVDTYNATPAHEDITPTGDFVPTRSWGVAVNRASKNRIIILGEDDSNDLKRFTSNNQGDSQTDQGATDYRGAFSSSPVQILFGDDTLDISLDNGVTFEDRRGNLADVFSSTAEIRKVKAII